MPQAKPKLDRKRNGLAARATPPGEVLTLGEAAAYLRVAEVEVLRLVRERGLPGRGGGGLGHRAIRVWLLCRVGVRAVWPWP